MCALLQAHFFHAFNRVPWFEAHETAIISPPKKKASFPPSKNPGNDVKKKMGHKKKGLYFKTAALYDKIPESLVTAYTLARRRRKPLVTCVHSFSFRIKDSGACRPAFSLFLRRWGIDTQIQHRRHDGNRRHGVKKTNWMFEILKKKKESWISFSRWVCRVKLKMRARRGLCKQTWRI